MKFLRNLKIPLSNTSVEEFLLSHFMIFLQIKKMFKSNENEKIHTYFKLLFDVDKAEFDAGVFSL